MMIDDDVYNACSDWSKPVFGNPCPNPCLGMMLELRKARKITRLRLVISRAFLNSRNIPACLDQAIQTRKP